MNSLREHICSFIGGLTPVAASPTVRLVERQSEEGFARSHVQYTVADVDTIEAFIFEPTHTTPLVGALALHQHNRQWTMGKREIAGLVGDPVAQFDRSA